MNEKQKKIIIHFFVVFTLFFLASCEYETKEKVNSSEIIQIIGEQGLDKALKLDKDKIQNIAFYENIKNEIKLEIIKEIKGELKNDLLAEIKSEKEYIEKERLNLLSKEKEIEQKLISLNNQKLITPVIKKEYIIEEKPKVIVEKNEVLEQKIIEKEVVARKQTEEEKLQAEKLAAQKKLDDLKKQLEAKDKVRTYSRAS